MSISLNQTIVHARDPGATAAFMVEMLAFPAPRKLGHFTVVQVGETSLEHIPTENPVVARHFAFKVSDPEFNQVLRRVRERRLPFWADPFHQRPDDVNHWDDGNGVYFDDPDGHLLQVVTRTYGGGGLHAALSA